MKRIFISTNYMELGGVERSLLGLLGSIDYNKYEVDLFIHSHTGELMDMIPSNVNLLPEEKNYNTYGKSIKEIFRNKNYGMGIARVAAKLYLQLYNKIHGVGENISYMTYIARFSSLFLPSLYKYGEYDLAISFLIPHNIVLHKVKAKKKIAWIHSDYSYVGLDVKLEFPIWNAYDYIGSISEDVTKAFISRFPKLENKIVLIENILSPDFVRQEANKEDISDKIYKENDEYIFCSVGRFSKQKNFINAVYIANHLKALGMKFKWYLIGYGSEENLIKEKIKELGIENFFIILGKKTNPYPCMKKCDFYIQPSLYEGKAVTVREAQMLYKPVIITDFPTAKSQVKNNFDGVIVPLDNKLAAKGIVDFINDHNKVEKIISNLHKNDFGNESEINKIYALL